jgi:hypothetical protein
MKRIMPAGVTAFAMASVFAAAPDPAQSAGQTELRPADFVRQAIAVPAGAESTDVTPGSAAERHARQRTLPPSYGKEFDLSGLPKYGPSGNLSGKLRIWGNNYILSSGVADAWKRQPQHCVSSRSTAWAAAALREQPQHCVSSHSTG